MPPDGPLGAVGGAGVADGEGDGTLRAGVGLGLATSMLGRRGAAPQVCSGRP